MKRLSSAHKNWMVHHALASAMQRKHSADKKKIKRSIKGVHDGATEGKWVKLYKNQKTKLVLALGAPKFPPARLSLANNYNETVTFLNDLRATILSSFDPEAAPASRSVRRQADARVSSIKSYWDFSAIESITVDVALIIASEYDRAKLLGAWVPGAINIHRWRPHVRQLLSGVGFFEAAGVNYGGAPIVGAGDWRLLKFRSGHVADGSLVDALLDELGVPEIVNDTELYDAVVEALVNTRHHAYSRDTYLLGHHVPYWWMTAFVNFTERKVRITTYDHGLSIPRTLPYWTKFPRFRRSFLRLFGIEPDTENASRDGEALALAMAVGRSSTEQNHRGRGLPMMEAAIDLCDNGHLTIYSRRGMYVRYRVDGQQRRKRETKDVGLSGTLVVWELQLQGDLHAHD